MKDSPKYKKYKYSTFSEEVRNTTEHFYDTLKRPDDMNAMAERLRSEHDKTDLADETKRADVLKRLFLTVGASNLIVKGNRAWRFATENGLPIAMEIGIGPRVLIEIPKIEDPAKANEFFNWLTSGSPSSGTHLNPNVTDSGTGKKALDEGKIVFTRLAATHDVTVDEHGEIKEKKLNPLKEATNAATKLSTYYTSSSSSEFFTGHFGMNVPVGRYGEVDAKGNVIGADGATGHLYMFYKKPTKDSVGGLLIGMEGSEPLVSGQYGEHSLLGASDEFTVSGGRPSKELEVMPKDGDYANSIIADRYDARKVVLTPEKMADLYKFDMKSLRDPAKLACAKPQKSIEDLVKHVNEIDYARNEFRKSDKKTVQTIGSVMHSNLSNDQIDNFNILINQLSREESDVDLGVLKDSYKKAFQSLDLNIEQAEEFRQSVEEHLAGLGRNKRLQLVYDVHKAIYKEKGWEIGSIYGLHDNRAARLLNATSSVGGAVLSTVQAVTSVASTALSWFSRNPEQDAKIKSDAKLPDQGKGIQKE